MIEILSAGPVSSVQDLGRTGHRAIGVGEAGAMDRLSLQTANILVGNALNAAGIENAIVPLRVRFHTSTVFSVAGAPVTSKLDGVDIPSHWTGVAEAGQLLEIPPSRTGMWTYLAVAGGIDVAPVLGSRSTDLKGRYGGRDGRALRDGDQLAACEPPAPARMAARRGGGFGVELPPTKVADGLATPIRVIPAREYACFGDKAQDDFWNSDWSVQADSNRIGYRLAGPTLELLEPLSLLSYGLIPGVVQVPPEGQPVVQLSEANTCGGYPKMAVIIGADLRLLAQTKPGGKLRFVQSTRKEAIQATQEEQCYVARVTQAVRRGESLRAGS